MDDWEEVNTGGTINAEEPTFRARIEGGYLYRYAGRICFVASRLGAPEAPRGGPTAIPSLRRPGPVEKETYMPPQPIDAEFEEVPPHQVNGSAAAGHMGDGHHWRRPSDNVPGGEFD